MLLQNNTAFQGDENTINYDIPPPSSPQDKSRPKSPPFAQLSEPRHRRKEPQALDIAQPGKKRRCAPALAEQVPTAVEQIRDFGPSTLLEILKSKRIDGRFVVSWTTVRHQSAVVEYTVEVSGGKVLTGIKGLEIKARRDDM